MQVQLQPHEAVTERGNSTGLAEAGNTANRPNFVLPSVLPIPDEAPSSSEALM